MKSPRRSRGPWQSTRRSAWNSWSRACARTGWRLWLVAALATVGVVAPVLVLVSGSAQASIMIALDLPTLVRVADHIAVVEVTSVTAAWDERHERIYSTIELKVIESWKAPATTTSSSDRLTVVQAGGTVDDVRMTVTGMGAFSPGERSLVFLRGPANRAQVVGMTQGKRALKYESASQHWMVSPPDLSQAKLVRPAGGVTPVSAPSSAAEPAVPGRKDPPALAVRTLRSVQEAQRPIAGARSLPLDDLRTEIQRLLAAAPR